MWFIIQLIFSKLAFSIFASQIYTGFNKSDNYTMKDLDRYTETEIYSIRVFRGIMIDVLEKEYQSSDDFLIRWLREANMDLKSANQSLRHALKWRQDNQMDSILNKTFTIIKNLPPACTVEGFDKTGGPIIIYKVMGFDIRNLLAKGYSKYLLLQTDQCLERYQMESISGGPKSEQIHMAAGIGILDIEGASMKQHGCVRCVELYRQIALNAIHYYPRNARFIVVINAPPFARKVVEMIKPFLSPYSKKTLVVFGTARDEWTQFLLGEIPEDQLLQKYGGTKQNNLTYN